MKRETEELIKIVNNMLYNSSHIPTTVELLDLLLEALEHVDELWTEYEEHIKMHMEKDRV